MMSGKSIASMIISVQYGVEKRSSGLFRIYAKTTAHQRRRRGQKHDTLESQQLRTTIGRSGHEFDRARGLAELL